MRDVERINRILNKIRALWYAYPDWRLGQMVGNLNQSSGLGFDPFYLEDDELEKALDEYLTNLGKPDEEDKASSE